MKIAVVGAGYVGLVSGTCLSELGHTVICIDNVKDKIKRLKRGDIPIYEPGLKAMIKKNVKKKKLFFSNTIKDGIKDASVVFICVNTPPKSSGEADLHYVEGVAREIAEIMDKYLVLVDKSTVPVGTGEWIKHTIKNYNKKNIDFDVVSNPEFLREGSAIKDFMEPDRIVIGVESKRAENIMKDIYKKLNAKLIITDVKSAEIIKHACNSFLATKISYINAIANICENVGADVGEVARGMGLDNRIGRKFLDAGIGFGGSCFPKDLSAFINISQHLGYDFSLLKEVQNINSNQRLLFIKKIKETIWNIKGKTIGILGLAFKPDTDDLRNAPAIFIIEELQKEGAKIKAYDPVAMKNAKKILRGVKYCRNAYETAADSDAIVIITDWDEFKTLNLRKIKDLLKIPVIIDGRNTFEPEKVRELGFTYKSIGRK